MKLFVLVVALTGCALDSEPDYYDDVSPWKVVIHVTAPVAFTALKTTGESPFSQTVPFDPATTSGVADLAFSDEVHSIQIDTDVDGKHYHNAVYATYTDYPNPMADQTLHRYEGSIALFELEP